MTQEYKLQATKRELFGKKVKHLREKGSIPGVVYGRKLASTALTMDAKEFEKVFSQAGTSALVTLSVDDEKPIKVLVHEPQVNPVTNIPTHVDFYAVRMDEKIETELPIHFVGESPAVEEQGGNFIVNKDALRIRCLPADLISQYEIDLSRLASFEDKIHVSDLSLPENIEVLDEPEEMIAFVEAPRSDEELEAELAEDTTSEKEAVEELDKEEAAEGEAGETAEPAAEQEKAKE